MEVLVAVLVLSIGLLGLAGLQIAGVRANDSARVRTQVTLAAYDLADRLRADPTSFFPLGQESRGTVALKPDACEGTQDTADAISRWQRDFCALGLPQPSSGDFAQADCGDANPCGAGNCAIIVRWDDRRGDRRAPANEETPGASDREFRFCTRIATAR
jgi:type IV pilus assembly protein PilV